MGFGMINKLSKSDVIEDVQNLKESMKFPEGKGLVAIRFDDNDYTIYQNAFPLLKARAMPFTSAIVANRVGTYSGRAKITDAQIKEMAQYGMEIAGHSYNHLSVPITPSEIYNEVVASRIELERGLGYHVRNLCEPGDWNNSVVRKSPLGEAILDTYSFYESYAINAMPGRPLYERFGVNHQSIDGHTNSATMKGWVDQVADRGKSVIIMTHSVGDIIGGEAGVSTAVFTELLDHIKTLRDQGKIEVVTDSGTMGSGVGTPYNYLNNGGFERLTTGSLPDNYNILGSPTITTTNPRSGTNALVATSTNYVTTFVSCYGMRSPVFKISAWHRTDTTGTARLMANLDTVRSITMPSTSSWQKIELTAGIPLGSERFLVYAQPSGAGTVIYDDLEVVRVG